MKKNFGSGKGSIDIKDAPAYWINPEGLIFSNFNLHIEAVCDNPKVFGLNRKYLKTVYQKHGETWRLEGKARDEIMEELYHRGWIRIRYVQSNNYYSVELGKLSDKNNLNLQTWANDLLEIYASKYKFSQLSIYEHNSGFTSFYNSIDDFTSGNSIP